MFAAESVWKYPQSTCAQNSLGGLDVETCADHGMDRWREAHRHQGHVPAGPEHCGLCGCGHRVQPAPVAGREWGLFPCRSSSRSNSSSIYPSSRTIQCELANHLHSMLSTSTALLPLKGFRQLVLTQCPCVEVVVLICTLNGQRNRSRGGGEEIYQEPLNDLMLSVHFI